MTALKKAAPLYFRAMKDGSLLTNDWGGYACLSQGEMEAFLAGGLKPSSRLWRELQTKGFIRDHMDFNALARRYAAVRSAGPGDAQSHTIEVSRRCNLKCVYCSAGARAADEPGQDMTEQTARAVAAFILSTPSRSLQIEFGGGEPLLNWPVIRLIIELIDAGIASSGGGRQAHFALSSNFSLMDADKLDYLARRGVNLCTSLDGPPDLHNANRVCLGGASHEAPAHWLELIQKMLASGLYPRMSPPNAVATVTRMSLERPEDIVEQFRRMGLSRVQLGPVEPFGLAPKNWNRVGITAEEYARFYRRALEYMIDLCRDYPLVYEKGAAIFLAAIFGRSGSVSHWAEGVCQFAYDIHGGVYPSDEGRLLACQGDDFFRLGHVRENRHADISRHRLVGAMVLWNLRQAQPFCSRCAYSPFCQSVRLSAPHHAAQQQRPWGSIASSRRCAIFTGVFDLLFEKLKSPRIKTIFERWADMAR